MKYYINRLHIHEDELYSLLCLLEDWKLKNTELYRELDDIYNLRDGRYKYVIINWNGGYTTFNERKCK